MRTRFATSEPPLRAVAQTVTRQPGHERRRRPAFVLSRAIAASRGQRQHQRLLARAAWRRPATMLAVRMRSSAALLPRALQVSTPVSRSFPGAAGAGLAAAGRRRALASNS